MLDTQPNSEKDEVTMTDNDVEKPRVLVIGASGNIGGAVAAALKLPPTR